MSEILPKYSNLKKLQMSVYSENELDAFCKFVEESPKTLEFLERLKNNLFRQQYEGL